MNAKEQKQISKFLSLILRHKPETVGVELDANGWTDIDTLLEKMQFAGTTINREILDIVVRDNPKKRFAYSDCGTQIRASQGHSLEVDLDYQPTDPPRFLYHGAPEQVVPAIRSGGLNKMQRHHVHLNSDPDPCVHVAERRGKAVVLKIRAQQMAQAGHAFFLSANGVWLTDHVPPEFIEFPPSK